MQSPPHRARTGLCHYLSLVTVEPALFLLAMGFSIELVFKTNMLVDKTCSIQLQYSSDVCHSLDSGNYKAQQASVQKLTANYNMYCQIIELLPGALVMLLLGTWSDTRSRRLPLLLPLVGSTLKSLGLCCNAYWWSLQPFYVAMAYIPFGLSGGMMATFMASYAYVSEDSGERGRTTRLSLAGMALFAALPFGNALGAALFSRGGYVAVFGLQFIANFIAFIYIAIRLREERPKQVSRTVTQEGKSITPLNHLRQSLATVFWRRPAGGRARILGHICCIFLYMITFGTINFMVLYTRAKFKWDYNQFTPWMICNSCASIVAACLLVPLLSFRCHIDDTILAFSGAASHAFFGVLIGTATEPWILYLAVVLSAGGGITISCSRGALSKLVAPDELGAVFSVVGILESLAPIISSLVNTPIYNVTLDVFPGTVFLISAGLTLVICCIYTWLATAFPVPPSTVSKGERG
ncbi:Proton-coupled folate transporter [Portunus trituberculatus]|uniref:Proton-coupled folate transporter n=1 Tax=Portunus trituberculatus TaxID=210409 RepID=A0A5B7CS78_PORTR|nr:Proton-coupled folate transporter [Portunus trituberculatus]